MTHLIRLDRLFALALIVSLNFDGLRPETVGLDEVCKGDNTQGLDLSLLEE